MDKRSRMQIKHSLEHKDYIEEWYRNAIAPRHSSILQEIFATNLKFKTIFHVIMHNYVHFANLDMNVLESLIHKWLIGNIRILNNKNKK